MPITMKDLKVIRDDLKNRKPAALAEDSNRPLSNREVIRQLAPTLFKMKERGFRTGDLVSLLAEHQVPVKSRDLTRYLRQYQMEKAQMTGPSTKAKVASLLAKKSKALRTSNQERVQEAPTPNMETSADDRNLEKVPPPDQADVSE